MTGCKLREDAARAAAARELGNYNKMSRVLNELVRCGAARELGTWHYSNGEWYIRYCGTGKTGDTILVRRRDRSTSEEVLGRRVAEDLWLTADGEAK